MSNSHPDTLLEILEDLATTFPHTAEGLKARLGLIWQFGHPSAGPAHFESDTAVDLADGTRITHVTHFPPGQPEVVTQTGLALENAVLTYADVERRYGLIKLVAAPSPNGVGPGRAWVYEVQAQHWVLRWAFQEGSKTLASVLFRAKSAAA